MMNTEEIMEWADEKIKKQRLPDIRKPVGRDPEFDFPDDPEELSSARLGQLMLKMTAFLGRSLKLYGLADSEFALVEADYKHRMNVLGLEKRKEYGRVSYDVIEAAVLDDADKELEALYERKQKLQTVRIQLDSRIKAYEKYYGALSRELSRRELEIKTS